MKSGILLALLWCWSTEEEPKPAAKKANAAQSLENDLERYFNAVQQLKNGKQGQAFEKFKNLGADQQRTFLEYYFKTTTNPFFAGSQFLSCNKLQTLAIIYAQTNRKYHLLKSGECTYSCTPNNPVRW